MINLADSARERIDEIRTELVREIEGALIEMEENELAPEVDLDGNNSIVLEEIDDQISIYIERVERIEGKNGEMITVVCASNGDRIDLFDLGTDMLIEVHEQFHEAFEEISKEWEA